MESVFRKDLLNGKHALITGGGSGIGLEIGRCLVNHGAKLIILGRSLKRLEEAAATLPQKSCTFFQCDVRNPEKIAEVVKAVLSSCGKIDILINCAAGNFLSPFSKLSAKGFRTVLEIDTMGTFNTTKEVFTQSMNKTGGVVINISSTLQMPAVNMQSHAAAAKAAIDSLTRSLAVELGPKGIRVNGVAPGAIDSTEGLSRLTPEKGLSFKEYIPLQRLGTAKEIGEAVLFLICSEYITGQTLVVDGGLTLAFPNFVLMFPSVFKSWSAKL